MPLITKQEFYRWDEAFKILYDKYRIIPEELIFWSFGVAKIEVVAVDLPVLIRDEWGGYEEYGGFYGSDPDPYFYADCFYCKDDIDSFEPEGYWRLIKIDNIRGRISWAPDTRTTNDILTKAWIQNRLNVYIPSRANFYVYKDWLELLPSQKVFFEDYILTPTSVFLLNDIVRIERAFFNRSLADCKKELNIYEIEDVPEKS